MFEQLTILALDPQYGLPEAADLDVHLQSAAFTPIGKTQPKTTGFVPPRGEAHGALVECIGGHYIARLAIETKSVPARAVREGVAAKVEAYRQETGRERVGSKLKREFKDEVVLQLLPQAFPKRADVYIWIDPETRRVVIGSASSGKVDDAISALVQAAPGFAPRPLQTQQSPVLSMTAWLMDTTGESIPEGFELARECVLKSLGDKATVKFSHHSLHADVVEQHIKAGKTPTQLAMTWQDRASFVLTENLGLKKVCLLDVGDTEEAAQDRFDADVLLATGTLTPCLDALIEGLGGLMDHETLIAP